MPSASLIKEFEQLVGKENVFSSEADRQSYAYDAAVLKPMWCAPPRWNNSGRW